MDAVQTNMLYKISEEHQLPEDFTIPHNVPGFNYLKFVFIKILH
jgi:23S rRNA (cytosine1962-C5)-methyltransferase